MQPSSHPEPPDLERPPSSFLDGRGVGAAWLILKVAQAVAALAPGQVLEVLGSDPRLLSDLPPVLARHGCRLLVSGQGQDGYRFVLAGGPAPGADHPHCKEDEDV